jgi:hypothetical protein
MLNKRNPKQRPAAPVNPPSRASRPPRREADRDSLDRFEGEGGNQEQLGEKERHEAPAPGRAERSNPTPPPG